MLCRAVLHSGSELRDDSQLVSQALNRTVSPSRNLVSTTVSEVPNTYTLPAPDFQAQWQRTVVGLLAQMVSA